MNRDFNEWLSGFRDSIADYSYYIDFEKVHRNVDSIKVELNILNSLIGSKNMPTETIYLMNHNQYCFDGARELNPCPYIIKSPSYKIQL